MNAVLKPADRRTRAQKITACVDYLKTKKGDEAAYLDDAILIDDNRRWMLEGANKTARDLLDDMESLNASAIGDFFIDRLIENVLSKADEQ